MVLLVNRTDRCQPLAKPLFAVFLTIACAVYLVAQDEPITVETNLTIVPVVVSDRDGRFIPGLQKKDFQLFENGEEQEIDYFRTTDEPLTTILLMDGSGSMIEHMDEIAAAASSFVHQLRPGDTILAAVFARKVTIIAGPLLAENFPVVSIRQKGENGTRLYDAVNWAMKKARSIRGRTAIVLFSDGADSYPTDGSFATAKETIKRAEEGTALYYTVWFDSFYRDEGMTEKTFQNIRNGYWGYMDDLAKATGGRSFAIDAIANLDSAFSRVATELRARYELGYDPSATVHKGERRKITVKVDFPGAVVRSRKEVVYK